MPPILLKILVIILLFFGEALAIYTEMAVAKNSQIISQPILQVFIKMFLLMIVASLFLIAAYMLGINAFKNIWIVSAISITSILLVEPILAWLFFHQVPTPGAIIGFSLGTIGLFIATFF